MHHPGVSRHDRGPRRAGGGHARLASLALLAVLGACADSTGVTDTVSDITFDFSIDAQGWVADFADYPVGKEAEWELASDVAPLPFPLDASRKAIRLTGTNHSDDLFMFITRGLTSLAPDAAYALRFQVLVATNAPRNCAGIGGAPGESVVLKVGATPSEPQRVIDAAQYYRTTFDYGTQAAGGRDATSIGNLANSNTNCDVPRYELKEYDTADRPLSVVTDGTGRLWLVVGIDSGFEGTTTAYILSVRVSLSPR